jgi:hypothetical protein
MQTLRERLMVKPEDLRRRVDPATLPFQMLNRRSGARSSFTFYV